MQIDAIEPVEDSRESDSESECGVILNPNVPEFVPPSPPDVSDLAKMDNHVHVVVDDLNGQDVSVGRDLVVDIVHEDYPIQYVAPIPEAVDSIKISPRLIVFQKMIQFRTWFQFLRQLIQFQR